jgi:hypothetical protein
MTRKCDVRNYSKLDLLDSDLFLDKRKESHALPFRSSERDIYGYWDTRFSKLGLPGAVVYPPTWLPAFFHDSYSCC